jgi:hypothetical protein
MSEQAAKRLAKIIAAKTLFNLGANIDEELKDHTDLDGEEYLDLKDFISEEIYKEIMERLQ